MFSATPGPAEPVTRTVTVTVDGDAPVGGSLTATAEAFDDGTQGSDLTPANNVATDVDAVQLHWGTRQQQPVRAATPGWLRQRMWAGGSMGPKVEAVCRFVEATGGRAAIGSLEALGDLVGGTAGTQVHRDGVPCALGSRADGRSLAGWA